MDTTYTIGTVAGSQLRIEVELAGGRFSASASTRDQGGQMQDTIREWANRGAIDYAEGWYADRLNLLLWAWDTYHLNDMRAGCEHQRAAGWDTRPIDPAKPLRAYGRHYSGQSNDTWNMLGWVRPAEHPDGLMGRPCPVCGYGYGTEWRREELPAEVVELIERGFVPAENDDEYAAQRQAGLTEGV